MKFFSADLLTCAIAATSDYDAALLHPDERSIVQKARAASRTIEFELGRIAARLALRQHGAKCDGPILKGSSGAPIWPAGIVGSISHTQSRPSEKSGAETVAAAIVGSSIAAAAVGLDLEDLRRAVDEGVMSRTCLPEESAWVLTGSSGTLAVTKQLDDGPLSDPSLLSRSERLIYILCCKEALFKALHPLTEVYLGFHDARVSPQTAEISLMRNVSSEWVQGKILRIKSRIVGELLAVWIVAGKC